MNTFENAAMLNEGGWSQGWGDGLTGPTTATMEPFCGGRHWEYTPVRSGRETIALVPIQAGESKESMVDRARLIAAAPEQHQLILEIHGWLRVNAGQIGLPTELRGRMANFADDCRRLIRQATKD